MNVSIVQRPTLRVAACRHTGAYNGISEAFGRLHALAAPAGLLREGAQMLAVYHDDPEITPEARLRSDAGLTVASDIRIPEGLTEVTIPGGRYAATTHVGPYETLGDAWARLMGEWLPRSGYRLGNGVSHEIYRNSPVDTPPEKLRTELLIPVVAEARVTSNA
jgi:AraC family transcriptional regulator